MIRIGIILHGFCDGYFGRDSYGCKRVEAIGADWLVAREIRSGQVKMAIGQVDRLEQFINDRDYCQCD